MNQVLWSGRLDGKPSEEAFAFESSIAVDGRLAADDIRGSQAHAAMAGKAGIISGKTASRIVATLSEIAKEIEDGTLTIPGFGTGSNPDSEDIHSFVENQLARRIGADGKAVHAGRSRNDQVVTDLRLYLKRKIPDVTGRIREFMRTLAERSLEHSDSIMPGYTHLQRAQPITLGHHLLAWAAMLDRDRGRFQDALVRLDECPLGAGALAGSGLDLDRAEVSGTLGFKRPTANSLDSVADRDFVAEVTSACAILMAHLSRFAEDTILWASSEFGFIALSDEWSTGSSIMPQKKNPDFAELVRGKSGRVFGDLMAILTVMKGLPLSYNRDLQEDKEPLFDALDTCESSLGIFRSMIASAAFDRKAMEAACSGGYLEATDAAEYLVRKGMPFRSAHETVAVLVKACIAEGRKSLADLPFERFREASGLFETDVIPKLFPGACVRARMTEGGTAPELVKKAAGEVLKNL